MKISRIAVLQVTLPHNEPCFLSGWGLYQKCTCWVNRWLNMIKRNAVAAARNSRKGMT